MSAARWSNGLVQLKVRVEDTGIGIPAEKLENVFEKFAQVDGSSTRRHEGTGLGLAIAARLVDLMGGKIGVESEIGRGSVFWFAVPLPAHEAARATRSCRSTSPAPACWSSTTIRSTARSCWNSSEAGASTAPRPKAAPSASPSSTAPPARRCGRLHHPRLPDARHERRRRRQGDVRPTAATLRHPDGAADVGRPGRFRQDGHRFRHRRASDQAGALGHPARHRHRGHPEGAQRRPPWFRPSAQKRARGAAGLHRHSRSGDARVPQMRESKPHGRTARSTSWSPRTMT